MTITDSLLAYVAAAPYASMFLLPVIGSIGFPLPEDAILVLCGMLISRRLAQPLPALTAVYTGILLSDYLIYAVGRRYGQHIVTHRIFRRIISPEQLEKIRTRFTKSGNLVILLGRQIFWLRAKIFLVAGILRMPVRRFLLLDAVAALCSVALMVSVGHEGSRVLSWFAWLMPDWSGAAVIIVIIIVIIYFRRIRGSQPKSDSAITRVSKAGV